MSILSVAHAFMEAARHSTAGRRTAPANYDCHHVTEAAGIVFLGLVFYSYTGRWLASTRRIDRRLRPLLNGLAFGLLTVALMISRIEVSPSIFVDARAVPIALVTLVEGGWAGLVAALVAAAYRLWLGGSGSLAWRARHPRPPAAVRQRGCSVGDAR
jgi:hypothetical protein